VVPRATLRAGGRHTSGIRPTKGQTRWDPTNEAKSTLLLGTASVGLAAGWREILDTRKFCVTCPVGQFWNSDPSGVEWVQLLFMDINLGGYMEGVDAGAQRCKLSSARIAGRKSPSRKRPNQSNAVATMEENTDGRPGS
jgi:hypothetical protein